MTLSEVFERAGGKTAVARMLGLNVSTPYSWTQVPGQHVFRLASALGVEPELLRPDMFAPAANDAQPEAGSANAESASHTSNKVCG